MKSNKQLRDRDCRNPHIYRQTLQFLGEFSQNHRAQFENLRSAAVEIRKGIESISPFIQQSTEKVCPNCSDICCISRHGYYSCEDLIYLHALGVRPPSFEFGREDSAPCQYLAENGCSMERWHRPSGCNWYFCEPLLERMETLPEYRSFDDSLQDIADLWIQMMEEFERVQTRLLT